jgi:hypothetical protein
MVCCYMQGTFVEEPERPVVGVAQPPARLGDLLENRIQPGRACDDAQNPTDRALLLPHVLEFACEVRAVPDDSSHSFSLREGFVQCRVPLQLRKLRD